MIKGECSISDPLFTAPSSAPLNPTWQILSSTTVKSSWYPPPLEDQNGIIRYYSIRITEIDTGDVLEEDSNVTWILLDFLHPYYTYSIQFAAVTVAQGPFGTSINFTTPEDGKYLTILLVMLL